jgi:hypothetical protein
MYKRVLKSILLTAVGVLMALPAVAQMRADVGPLHIRIARDAPPRARYESLTARPYADAVWINGSWDRQDDRWAWVSGRWERPNNRGSRWVNARYAREGCPWYRRQNCSYRYEPAHWSNQQLVEGDDYQQWRTEQRSGRGGRR